MRIQQLTIDDASGPYDFSQIASEDHNVLALVFGAVAQFERADLGPALSGAFPNAVIVGCTTAGEITGTGVSDGSLTLTAVRFESTTIRTCCEPVPRMQDSEDVGRRLGAALVGSGLRYVLVLGDGVGVNGAALVKGITAYADPSVSVSGGLAGDAGKFERTWLVHNGMVQTKVVVAVGFYGDALRVRHGCAGGWTVFGPRRTVTKGSNNVVYELDGRPILDMYEQYLGEEAKDLPQSGLLYPLAILSERREQTGIIRTILEINREDGSMAFAGGIEEGSVVQLMCADEAELIQGAVLSASQSRIEAPVSHDALALLISCIGRRLLLDGRVSQEVRAVIRELGPDFHYTGFYSNGEISPFQPTGRCEFHNETMTITTLCEAST
ncbi:MAG: FIST C-terminal domain-containing protein [Phycisphaerae bacterium]|nr:FIST C-terminal domain-containing protein [Phycisphaerae bacterium]